MSGFLVFGGEDCFVLFHFGLVLVFPERCVLVERVEMGKV
jgi:hypothetical protein